jgi:hypothetical protein
MTLALLLAGWFVARRRLVKSLVDARGVALVLVAVAVPGCAQWEAAQYNLSKLKDDRVSDIESNLDRRAPVVASPFGAADKPSSR